MTVTATEEPGLRRAVPGRRRSVSVARALGSSTRAGIFEHLQEAGVALTVRDVAGVFDVHPNVARTHLETLADAGLVEVGRRKHPGGGRPAKIYLARDDAPVVGTAPDGDGATALLVRLLTVLAEQPSGSEELSRRAHHAAVAEGRQLVAELPAEHRETDDLEAAAVSAVDAVRTHAPEAQVVKAGQAGQDWVDVAGIRGLFAVADDVRPGLGEVLEDGLLRGALEALGVVTTIADAGTAPDGTRVVRLRRAASGQGRHPAQPAASVDARNLQREAGVVRAMREITRLPSGAVLEVLARGPGSPAAFARWADRAGHELLAVERAADATGRAAIRLLIRKGAA